MPPIDTSVTFEPVDTGDMSEIPPDLPAGEWTVSCKITNAASGKGSYPQLRLQMTVDEALTEGNDKFVGGRTTEFITFFPEEHAGSRMGKLRVKALCEAWEIEMPTTASLSNNDWSDLEAFVEAVESKKHQIWTTVEADRQTGEKRTRIYYSEPGASMTATEEEDKPKPAAKKSSSKTNGKGKTAQASARR